MKQTMSLAATRPAGFTDTRVMNAPMDAVLRAMVSWRSNRLSELATQVKLRPNEEAMVIAGSPISWAELQQRVAELADGLHQRNVRFGDVVTLMMVNRGEFFQAVLAVHQLGAIAVPVSYRLPLEQIVPILQDAGSHSLLVDEQLVDMGERLRDKLVTSTGLIVLGTPEPSTTAPPTTAQQEADRLHPPVQYVGRRADPALAAASRCWDDDYAEQISVEDESIVSVPELPDGLAVVQLLDQVSQRQTWLQASTEITRQLLSGTGEDPLQVIARRLQDIAEADLVNIVVPAHAVHSVTVSVATGAGADQLVGHSYPLHDSKCQEVLEAAKSIRFNAADDNDDKTPLRLGEIVPVGPVMMLPLAGIEQVRGVVIVGRLSGQPEFTADDLMLAETFANQAAVALEMSDIRHTRAQSAVLEDRDRIARDLHDHVIQQLFGAGLAVESVAGRLGARPENNSTNGESLAGRLAHVVATIDQTIGQIRTSIFQLRGSLGPELGRVRMRLLALADDVSAVLGFQPRISFTGPVDAVVPDSLLDDLVAVAREAMTNVARHAAATRMDVNVAVEDGVLLLDFIDNGIGIGENDRRSGLDNLRRRASLLGGTLEVHSPSLRQSGPEMAGGTNVLWSIPLS